MARDGEADTAVEAGAVADLAAEAVDLADLAVARQAVAEQAAVGEVCNLGRKGGAWLRKNC